jgi:hypothetical protein
LAALANRSHYAATDSIDGAAGREHTLEAARRASAIDPDNADAADASSSWVLKAATRSARLAKRERFWPGGPRVQTRISVCRSWCYGGALDESARECDTPGRIDRGDRALRSCVFLDRSRSNPSHEPDRKPSIRVDRESRLALDHTLLEDSRTSSRRTIARLRILKTFIFVLLMGVGGVACASFLHSH